MGVPSKLQQGQNFKTATVKKINQIVDYLKTQRVIGDNKTIKVNQLTSGVSISSIQNATSAGGGGGALYRPPFSLGISSLESGEKVLTVKTAKIIINGEQGDRVYFSFDDIENGEYIPLPTEQGLYDVIGYIAYDPENGIQNNGAWTFGCVYMEGGENTSLITNSIGFCAFYIGQIKVSKVDDVYNYAVVSQVLHSDLAFYDGDFQQPFKLWLSLSNYPQNGDFVEELNADTINISAGEAIINDEYLEISSYQQNLDFETMEDYLYCFTFSKDGTGYINSILFDQWQWFDAETSQFNLPLGNISFSDMSGIAVFQVFSGMFVFNSNDKVLLNESDQTSGYLQDKLTYTIINEQDITEDKQKYFENGNRYITGVTRNLNKDETDSDGNPLAENLQDQLFWDYTSIYNYNKENQQVLANETDQLMWIDQSDIGGLLGVVGSAEDLFEFYKNENYIDQNGVERTRNQLRYKPEYLTQQQRGLATQRFIMENHDGKMIRLYFDDDIDKSRPLIWNYETKSFQTTAPLRENTDDTQKYLFGFFDKEIAWFKLEQVSGAGLVLCSKNDQFKNYLKEKLCSEKQSILFNIVETHPEGVPEDLKHQAINLQVNPQFLKDKLKIDQSLKDVLTIEMQEETGILNIKPVFPQNIQDCVLGRKDGKIQWIPLGTCQESQNE